MGFGTDVIDQVTESELAFGNELLPIVVAAREAGGGRLGLRDFTGPEHFRSSSRPSVRAATRESDSSTFCRATSGESSAAAALGLVSSPLTPHVSERR